MQKFNKNKLNSNSRYKAVIIGCGWVAGGYDEIPEKNEIRTHAQAYALNDQVELIAASDTDASRLAQFGQRWGLTNTYNDVQAMLNSHMPDIVSICAPDETHRDLLEMCIEVPSVKGIWCEKPLASSSSGCYELLERVKKARITLLVNYMRSFSSEYIQLKHRIQGGEFGNIQKVCVYYTKGIMHNGSHAMDLLLDWFGEPDSSVFVSHAIVDYDPEDPTVDASLIFNGIPINFVGLNESYFSIFELEIYTDQAQLSFEEFGRRLVIKSVANTQASGHKVLGKAKQSNTRLSTAMGDVLSHLISSIEMGKVEVNGDRALKGLEITAKLANLGKRIKK